MSHLQKKTKTNPEASEIHVDLPIQQNPGYPEFCEVRIFCVDGLSFKHIL